MYNFTELLIILLVIFLLFFPKMNKRTAVSKKDTINMTSYVDNYVSIK